MAMELHVLLQASLLCDNNMGLDNLSTEFMLQVLVDSSLSPNKGRSEVVRLGGLKPVGEINKGCMYDR
jgi:hypothetical protein